MLQSYKATKRGVWVVWLDTWVVRCIFFFTLVLFVQMLITSYDTRYDLCIVSLAETRDRFTDDVHNTLIKQVSV